MADIIPALGHNLTNPIDEPPWGKPEFKLPGWTEPVMILSVLFGSMIITRRRGYRILGGKPGPYKSSLDTSPSEARSTDELLDYDSENDDDRQSLYAQEKTLPKTRSCLGLVHIHTPNSSRFKNHLHSRLLQRFPFLVEMFYWGINWAFYRTTAYLANELYKDTGIWHVAQAHGLNILEAEQLTWLRLFFPVHELDVQHWFLHGHQTALTVLNRAYSLVHIPGTVGFIAWYYYAAPSHPTFAVVRRTITLTNFLAFLTFILYPVMPPRFLPKEYGFLDTVRHDDAQSVWMSGKYVNALAAMPSMHLGYSFAIGCTLLHHSGLCRRHLEKNEARKNLCWKTLYILLGVLYPVTILVTIIATANHYWLDAVAAVTYVCVAWWSNRIFYVFVPLEDWFLCLIRAEKPIPSTGERFHARGGRL